MNGILCIDKPQGFTSFDVIGKLRGILHMRRLGHAGTLDPMATGVLPVFVGCATKACGILPDDRKAYTAQFQLGMVTDTQDSTGTVLQTHPTGQHTAADVVQILENMTGETEQIPPMYSAVQVNGKRLYELAREGKTVERKARRVRIDALTLRTFDGVQGTLEIRCGSGTYVRTVIHDMGQALGCGAVMTGLRRTVSNGFGLDMCRTLEEVQQLAAENAVETAVIPTETAFACLPAVHLDAEQTRLYRNGVRLGLAQVGYTGAERCAVFGTAGFLGTAVPAEGKLRMERNFFGGD